MAKAVEITGGRRLMVDEYLLCISCAICGGGGDEVDAINKLAAIDDRRRLRGCCGEYGAACEVCYSNGNFCSIGTYRDMVGGRVRGDIGMRSMKRKGCSNWNTWAGTAGDAIALKIIC